VNSLRALAILLFLAGGGWLLYLLAPVFTPFLVGALIAYLCNPLVVRLVRLRLPRPLAVVLVFAAFTALLLALLLVLIPLAERQLAAFLQKLPDYLDWLQRELRPRLETVLGMPIVLDLDTLRQATAEHWRSLGGWAGTLLGEMTASGLRLLGWLASLMVVPVVSFYLLLDWEALPGRVLALLPPRLRAPAARLLRESDEVLASFLRGQLAVMLILAAVYATGLWWIGLELALTIGLAAGLASFVPYLGFLVGIAAAGLAAYLQFQEASVLLWVLAVFAGGQLLEGLVLTPRLVGERVGLHPVAVIFAVMAGGQLFGFLGVLLALPAAAVLKVWLRHLHAQALAAAASPPPRRQRARPPSSS
jgi:predicted PurR-regulated permease PerM